MSPVIDPGDIDFEFPTPDEPPHFDIKLGEGKPPPMPPDDGKWSVPVPDDEPPA